MLATLEWYARNHLLEKLPDQQGPRAQAILNSQDSREKLVYPLIDPLLGWGSNKDSIENQSVIVLKSNYQNPKKVLILGGSTSDFQYDKKSWPYFLSQIFNETGEAVEVHAGAVSGYSSHQELLKIVRDARLTDYDLILSYTGVNEAVERRNKHPFTPFHTQYFLHRALSPSKLFLGISQLIQKWTSPLGLSFGPKDEKTIEQRFLTNIKSAHALSKVYEANYMTILQPYLTSGDRVLSAQEEKLKSDDFTKDQITRNKSFYEELIKKSKKLDFLYDGTKFLDQMEHTYRDDCHINTEGNKIVAQKIFNLIKRDNLLD